MPCHSLFATVVALLGVTGPATTVSSTTTATATTATTVLTVETAISQTTTSTTSTTVTGVVATATRVVEHSFCENGKAYNAADATGEGTNVYVDGTSPEECCRRCWERAGCAISMSFNNGRGCQLVLVRTQQSGPGSETCPLGVWPWTLGQQGVEGVVFRGPCG